MNGAQKRGDKNRRKNKVDVGVDNAFHRDPVARPNEKPAVIILPNCFIERRIEEFFKMRVNGVLKTDNLKRSICTVRKIVEYKTLA